MGLIALTGCDVHDGVQLHSGAVLLVHDGVCAGIVAQVPSGADARAMPPGFLAPGLVDLQVNGGGGVMLNDAHHDRRAPQPWHQRHAADADHRLPGRDPRRDCRRDRHA